jgi:hypothetical protein
MARLRLLPPVGSSATLPAVESTTVRARLFQPPPVSALIFERTVGLSACAADLIVGDALLAGRGATLVLTIVASGRERVLAWLDSIFTRLEGRGIATYVRLGYRGTSPAAPESTPRLALVPTGLRIVRSAPE